MWTWQTHDDGSVSAYRNGELVWQGTAEEAADLAEKVKRVQQITLRFIQNYHARRPDIE
ncbi:MAG TPA: hypothetical protein VLA19_20530 [Herpetosiphonaceae bacterium]|nr:hypothetical protein [Herpetosiphonaceae bacterium]